MTVGDHDLVQRLLVEVEDLRGRLSASESRKPEVPPSPAQTYQQVVLDAFRGSVPQVSPLLQNSYQDTSGWLPASAVFSMINQTERHQLQNLFWTQNMLNTQALADSQRMLTHFLSREKK